MTRDAPDPPVSRAPALTRMRCLALGLACVLLVLFFHQWAGWNGNSRLLTVYALVEEGTLRADRWRGLTGDYAELDGHLYSDKAPLASFVVTPFYWVWRHGAREPQTAHDQEAAIHIADTVACAIPFAVFAMLVFRRLARRGLSLRAVVWITLGAAFASPLRCYGSQFLGNMLAATLFLGAYVLAVEDEDNFELAGLLGGLAGAAEYPLILSNAVVLFYLLLGQDRWRRSARYVFGASAPAILLLLYNRQITGHLFDFPYAHENSHFPQMHTVFGMALPSPNALWELTFGQYRGALFYAPALLVLLPLLVLRFDGPARRRRVVLALMGSQLLLISSYFMWNGGFCVGPRHLALFMALGLYEGVAALAGEPRWRLAFALLSAWGILLNLVAVATDALPNDTWHSPVFEIFFPRIQQNDINSHNLLAEAGLPNHRYTLAVWLGALVVAGLALSWSRASTRLPKGS
jgi:hypothetical protein